LASERPPRVDGAILVSPAVWSRSDMPLSYRAALWIAARFVPGMHVSGKGLRIVACDNIEVLRKLSRDPIYQHPVRADQADGLVTPVARVLRGVVIAAKEAIGGPARQRFRPKNVFCSNGGESHARRKERRINQKARFAG